MIFISDSVYRPTKLQRAAWYLFRGRRWVRKWIGGRWELWYVEPVKGDIWFHDPVYNSFCGTNPGACFGTPIVEEYPRLPKARLLKP